LETAPVQIVFDKPQVPETAPVQTDNKSVVIDSVPDATDKGQSDLDFLDSIPAKEPDTGMRVASRSKAGITVMKVKE
jgi:hypothetical protein